MPGGGVVYHKTKEVVFPKKVAAIVVLRPISNKLNGAVMEYCFIHTAILDSQNNTYKWYVYDGGRNLFNVSNVISDSECKVFNITFGTDLEGNRDFRLYPIYSDE